MPSAPRARSPDEIWTTRKLLQWMTGFFESRDLDGPRVVAELLLAHVLGCERLRLYMEVDRPATPGELERLRALVARAGRYEPVQYLVGTASFFLREFEVNDSTLIPQPCTETLVEIVIERLRERASCTIADIGTGTGCIAVSLACALPRAAVVATDPVPEALELAARNAHRHGVSDRIEFRVGPGFAPLAAARFDAVCSNPPYIPDSEIPGMDPAVREHVPRRAWSGGVDGLDVIRPLLAGVRAHLEPGGLVAMEIASSQGDAVVGLAREAGLREVEVRPDYEGLPRVLVASAPE